MNGGHIVAMGGGGFSMEPDNPLLDDFVLGLSGQDNPRVCFIATASGDAEGYIRRFYEAFGNGRTRASHLPLFNRVGDRELASHIREQDVFYIGGGNVANLLAIWRLHGVDGLLRAAWQAGAVLAGVSAGMICWFEQGLTDSFGPQLEPVEGLGWLPGSAAPHFDGELLRRPRFHALIATGRLGAGLAADDGAALHFAGAELREVVTSRPSAGAYRVVRDGDSALETPLPVRYLGA